MGKVEENKKRKREALLNAAFSLFTSQGEIGRAHV